MQALQVPGIGCLLASRNIGVERRLSGDIGIAQEMSGGAVGDGSRHPGTPLVREKLLDQALFEIRRR
jgi:hypothetical protein